MTDDFGDESGVLVSEGKPRAMPSERLQKPKPPDRRRQLLPIAAAVAAVALAGTGVYACVERGRRSDASASATKLRDENKALTDALELLRASSGDLGGQLKGCKDELTTQVSTFQEVDKRRTVLETDLTACKSNVKDLRTLSREQQELLAEFKGLTAKFQRMIDSGKLDVAFRRGNMVVKLPASILFPSGSADLSEGGRAAIGEVAAILKQMTGRRFTVAGHTDNIPVGNGPFKDNWELSALRAVKVTSLLINKGVPAPNLVAAGYGEHDPIASNATGSGRQKNRRIEIILEPNLKQVPAKALLQKPAPTAKGKAKPPAKPKPKSGP